MQQALSGGINRIGVKTLVKYTPLDWEKAKG